MQSHRRPTKSDRENRRARSGRHAGEKPARMYLYTNAKRSSVEDAYFIADAELCGYEYFSDPTWRCTTEIPIGDAWLKKNFDASSWTRPRIVNEDAQKPLYMSENSHWLTSREPAKEFYCRLEVINPVHPISYLNGH